MLDPAFLHSFRSLLIQLLNLIDDKLGLERTVPSKPERRWRKKKDIDLKTEF